MTNSENSAIECIHIICQLMGKYEYTQEDDSLDLTFEERVNAIRSASGLSIKQKTLKLGKISNKRLPLIFSDKDGNHHILAKSSEDQYLVQSPNESQPVVWERSTLAEKWNGDVIIVDDQASRFDIRWFIPSFLEHKRMLGEILLFSFVLQILALVSPLFFQVVMDKVLIHQAWSTLDVLVFGLVVCGLVEVIMRALREYQYAHTANRIDIHLGLKLVRHLFGLPLLYFKSRQVGAIVTRVRELDSIREFLTGSMFTLLVDVLFMGVFLVVMYILSPTLTYIFAASIPFYIVLAWWLTPRMHEKVQLQFTHAAANTSFLTESVSGSETIKSLAVEPRLQRRWDAQTAKMVDSGYQTQRLNNQSSNAVLLIQKVTSVCILWVGAAHVLDLKLTIGQLIAFNMMATHLAQPLARVVELWGQFIQARVGIENLGEMLNLPCEHSKGTQQPSLSGQVRFDNVVFRYQPDSLPVINQLNLDIKAGETIGIVGPSGSGKSTLARLLLRLYLPEQGTVTLDGHEITELDIAHLRQQIGVVLQESFLFNKTVRENIAQSQPDASLEDVIDSAKLAGAHDFILKLPMGYDTVIAEGGSSLSGGQRQRLAIARTLLGNPKVLIFDEATSALDDESQAYIQKNMGSVSAGRTVITIAHRLSTVRQCDRIIVLRKGSIVEQGSHSELLALNGQYQKLWLAQQELKQE